MRIYVKVFDDKVTLRARAENDDSGAVGDLYRVLYEGDGFNVGGRKILYKEFVEHGSGVLEIEE